MVNKNGITIGKPVPRNQPIPQDFIDLLKNNGASTELIKQIEKYNIKVTKRKPKFTIKTLISSLFSWIKLRLYR